MRLTVVFMVLAGLAPAIWSGRSFTALGQESTVYVCPMHPDVQSSTTGSCPKCKMKLVVQPPKAKQGSQGEVYVCSMHPEVQSSTPGNCPKCEMKLVVQAPKKKPDPQAEAYVCPMHLEVRSDRQGKCPKCDMALVPVDPPIPGNFNLVVESTPPAIKANQPLHLKFSVFNPKTREQVKEFAPLHEKLFHLFVVSQDMSEFQHIHPAFAKDGSFTIETVLPKPGHYKLYSDFHPAEGVPQVLQTAIVTAGYKSDLFGSEPRLTVDEQLTKAVDGMKIELTLEPGKVIAGKPVTLKYHLTDSRSGNPVRNLRPYLAAWGHTLILSEDQSDYVHSHPVEVIPEAKDPNQLQGGPDVTFEALLPRPGRYRVWSQFLRGELLTTVSFTIRSDVLR